ncbi:Replication protein O [Fibrobacterota bacterium]
MTGWIKLHRKIKEHWLYQINRPFTKREAWIDLLLEVNHGTINVNIGNEIITCGPGESIKSLDSWGKRWRWHKSKVRRFLECLENDSMLERKSTHATTHLKITNWDTYQSTRNEDETYLELKRNEDETLATPNKNVKNEKNNFSPDSLEIRLSQLLLQEIKNHKNDFKEPNLQKWAKHVDLMIRLDNREPEQIKDVILWCQNDSFWYQNILSTQKLRAQFDRLEFAMKADEKKIQSPPEPEYVE